jgi:hypothetical protein
VRGRFYKSPFCPKRQTCIMYVEKWT